MASRKTSNQQRKRPECHTPDLTITQPLNADVRLYIEDANDVLLQPVKDELSQLGLPVREQWYEKSCWVGSWILPCDLDNLAHKVVELTRILMSVDAAR